ncbi:MAG TPA: YbfB/YjiJ family MFS transporter [Stellaceae bacterium]
MGVLRAPAMNIWRAAFAASSAGLICIGMARLAYTPMIPALIEARWFSQSAIIYFGAANLAGYLLGAVVARRVARLAPSATLIRIMMVVVTLSFFACAWPQSWLWYFCWRFIAGVAGAVVMVLAAPAVLAHVPPARRGMVGGAIFAGLGAGVAISGTLVPLLLCWGLVETWCGLGVFSALLTAAAWTGFSPDAAPSSAPSPAPRATRLQGGGIVVVALLIEYALNATAQVPHMVFLSDFIARGLHRGIDVAGVYWVIFGIGAIVGPLVMGPIADRIGFRATFRFGLVLEVADIALILLSASDAALAISSFLMGALIPGMVTVTVGRIQELIDGAARQRAVWAAATIGFAIGQAASGYFFSYLFVATGGVYAWLFGIGAAMALLALAIDLGASARNPA